MITVEQALKILEDNTSEFGVEKIALSDSINRVLKENWHSDRDLPPYDRVTMDGIAIQYEAFKSGLRIFPIQDIAAAGMPQKTLDNSSNCMEVMTGSIMPDRADTVIRYEDLEIKDVAAKVITDEINSKQNVHYKGEDRKAGDLLVKENTIISPAEIGVGASIGKTEVLVARLPRTLVISTGDELVPINAQPLDHQIRRSNVYRLVTTLKHYGIAADNHHLNDDLDELTKALQSFIEEYDVIILSGGVSKGKFDYLPEVLEKLGVTKLFHKIKQRPGKPFWFGKLAKKCTVFALPGNPVSSFLCMQRYFKYWLEISTRDQKPSYPHAVLEKDVSFKPDLTYFLEVKIKYASDGKIYAKPIKGNGSGDLANMVDADAFIELPRGSDLFRAGEVYPFFLYRLNS